MLQNNWLPRDGWKLPPVALCLDRVRAKLELTLLDLWLVQIGLHPPHLLVTKLDISGLLPCSTRSIDGPADKRSPMFTSRASATSRPSHTRRNHTYRSIFVFTLVALLPHIIHVQTQVLEITHDSAKAIEISGDTTESRAGSTISTLFHSCHEAPDFNLVSSHPL